MYWCQFLQKSSYYLLKKLTGIIIITSHLRDLHSHIENSTQKPCEKLGYQLYSFVIIDLGKDYTKILYLCIRTRECKNKIWNVMIIFNTINQPIRLTVKKYNKYEVTHLKL